MAEKVLFSYKENLLRYDNMSRDFGMSDAHFHNFYEVYFLVSGKCRFSVENHIYDINKNIKISTSVNENEKIKNAISFLRQL